MGLNSTNCWGKYRGPSGNVSWPFPWGELCGSSSANLDLLLTGTFIALSAISHLGILPSFWSWAKRVVELIGDDSLFPRLAKKTLGIAGWGFLGENKFFPLNS